MAASSGLSLERFMKGKTNSGNVARRKRKIFKKAQQIREYRQLKEKELRTTTKEPNSTPTIKTKPTNTYYDQFFSSIAKDNSDVKETLISSKDRKNRKPDPFYQAKQNALNKKREKEVYQNEKENMRKEIAEKNEKRKKRKFQLCKKSFKGQPILKHHIHDVLQKLQQNS